MVTRIALGAPDSPRVAERGTQKGIDDAMVAKIRNALTLYRPQREAGHAEIRLHRTVLYNSIYRADDEMLVKPRRGHQRRDRRVAGGVVGLP